jgi:hypothetical protein
MHVALAAGRAEYQPVGDARPELWRNGQAGDRVAHNDLCPRPFLDDDETVAAIEQIVTVAAAEVSKVESLRRYVVRRAEDGGELGVGDEAPLAPADR